MRTRYDVVSSPRLAGQLLRYHTWPVLHRQSNGEHTWQVMRIYTQIWGSMLPEVSAHILWDDAGEMVTGDLPFPVKKNNLELRKIVKVLEAEALSGMGVSQPLLHPVAEARIKVADLLEMWEFGLHELALGNQFGRPIADDTYAAAWSLVGRELAPDTPLVRRYVDHVAELFRSVWRADDNRA